MKKRTGIILMLLTILASSYSFAQKTEKFDLTDLYKKRTFGTKSVYGLRSMSDGEHYTTYNYDSQSLVRYNYKTGKVVDTILNMREIGINGYSNYEFSTDESKILIETNYQAIYRHSYTADYFVYDFGLKKLSPLSANGKQQLATFSPDGSKVAFVRENNIFIKYIATDQERPVTKDGEFNKILNGMPDWVYEEEFGFNKAFEWSPSGNFIAFIKFNESKVKTFGMTVFAGQAPNLAQNALYPENRVWKYPKAGDANSTVSVHVYNLDNHETAQVDIGENTDIYIPRVRWTQDNNALSVFRLNRLQNKLEIIIANPLSGNSRVMYTEKNKFYISESVLDNIIYLEDKKHFVITSEKDGFNHIYLYDLNGKQVRQITKGNWDVTNFIGFNNNKKIFYYQSAEESPMRRSVYSVNFEGEKKKKLSKKIGMNNALFSTGYKYFINYYSSIDIPGQVTLHDAKGRLILELAMNEKLLAKVQKYGGVNKKFISFKTTEGVQLNGWMITPPYFDETKKYPVLMYQYSGPNSQTVLDRWSFGWDNLVAQNGYIVVSVDGRGTGARGEAFRKKTYLQLGKYETIDQIETAKYLRTLPYVEKSRIGIWGWSYGGFMTLLAMTKGADYFTAGVSVAPVTNWRYYDNIYTERFMRTPQENASGYDDNSPTTHADKLKGKLLIMHGSADDNVHLQNTMEFTEALVQANKQFDMHIFTNRNHGIYGGNTSFFLRTKMLNFLLENL